LGPNTSAGNTTQGLYIGDLQWWTTEQQLEDLFASVGPLLTCKIFADKSNGKSKGYAFIEYQSPVHAAAARDKLNNVTVNGRPMVVSLATPQRMRQIQMHYKTIEDQRHMQQMQQLQQHYPPPGLFCFVCVGIHSHMYICVYV
jgi:RNA recognition motif-containing protein